MGEQREIEVKVEHLVVDVEEKQVETTVTPCESSDSGGNIRGWFAQLTNEERMVALSFSDDAFIDAVFKITSSPSSTLIAENSGTALPAQAVLEPHNRDNKGVQWEKMFMIKEFAKLYEAFKEKTYVEDTVEPVETAYPSIPSESLATCDEETVEDQQGWTGGFIVEKFTDRLEELEADDAFRIHPSLVVEVVASEDSISKIVEKGLAVANGKKAASLALSSLAKRANDTRGDTSRIPAFMKNIQLVFPSTVELAKGRVASPENTPSPILVLMPSFYESLSGDELLHMFDDVLGSAGLPPFLSNDFSGVTRMECRKPAVANNWLHLLGNKSASWNGKLDISLGLLMVIRLEYAVFETYVAGAQQLGRPALGLEVKDDVDDAESKPFSFMREEADGSSSEQWATAPEEDSSSDDQNVDERSLKGHSAPNEITETEFTLPNQSIEKAAIGLVVQPNIPSPVCYIGWKGPVFSSRENIMNSLSSSVHVLDELYQRQGAGERNCVMSPLLEIIGDDRLAELNASHLLAAPLEWFIQPRQGQYVDLRLICKAVETSLNFLMSLSNSAMAIDYARDIETDDVPETKTVLTVDPSEQGNTQQPATSLEIGAGNFDLSVSAKKLKKKKRRKKRKSVNVDTETLGKDGFIMGRGKADVQDESQRSEKPNLDGDLPCKSTPEDVPVTTANQVCGNVGCHVPDGEQPPSSAFAEVVLVKSVFLKADDDVLANPIDRTVLANQSGTRSVTVPTDNDVQNTTLETDDRTDEDVGARDESGHGEDDGSAWETVEVRGRSSRKKTPDRGHMGRSGSHHYYSGSNGHGGYSSTGGMHGSYSKKSKGARTAASRKRSANRKIVREILSSVLDVVDEEVRRRKKQSLRPAVSHQNSQVSASGAPEQRVENKKTATLRDLVVGVSTPDGLVSNQTSAPPSPVDSSYRVLGDLRSPCIKNPEVKRGDKFETRPPFDKPRTTSKAIADQNTAPTVPETMSAVSANSTNTDGLFGGSSFRRRSETGVDQDAARSESSYEELIEAQKELRLSCSTTDEKDSSPAPPLPTLLSPGNADSASSSVASSLEVPHGHHHHRSYSANENVGYHLLDVCDRLTRDMNVFMDRRGLALNIRRRERGALLAALQDTLSKLWPARCQVNMYGSCATQLDLPSSDLDVVVCGLDRKGDTVVHSSPSHPKSNNKKSGRRGNPLPTEPESADFSLRGDLPTQYMNTQTSTFPYSPFSPFGPMQLQSINGERVIRLAAELERQPWAVHVKAIPTATVPVVKILADPAKLPGAQAAIASAADWMSHRQHMAAQAAIAAGMNPAVVASPGGHPAIPHYHPLHTPLPWRGADVMNGLMSVDITFEGPEHGGIGSTKLSSRIVKEACEEYSCSPERVPLVQVLMVLKEMLAQRRLNEPFSGGMSSYALLLLVDGLVKERAVIREELERVERQRRVVAAGGGNSVLGDDGSRKTRTDNIHRNKGDDVHDISENRRPGDLSGQVPLVSTKANPKNSIVKSNLQQENSSEKSTNTLSNGTSRSVRKEVEPKPASNKAHPLAKSVTSSSSWASVARKNTSLNALEKLPTEEQRADDVIPVAQLTSNGQQAPTKHKVSTFADAVARSVDMSKASADADNKRPTRVENRVEAVSKVDQPKTRKQLVPSSSTKLASDIEDAALERHSSSFVEATLPPDATLDKSPPPSTRLNQTSASTDSALVGAPHLFPQGSNDVVEVLCSGDTSAGKLLMHFLLFYGQHFDASTTAIDVSGKHPDVSRAENRSPPFLSFSPYIQRRPGGTIDPVSGMLTVDPIVVYDPLEGAENNNVSRSCFLWSNIRWVFAQSYNTLSSAVERSPTPPITPGRQQQPQKMLTTKAAGLQDDAKRKVESNNTANNNNMPWRTQFARDDVGQSLVDSPLLELLLSF